MAKFIEVTIDGEKRIICVGMGMDIIPSNKHSKKVNIIDNNLCRNNFVDETYEEIKSMLGIVKG